jgi:rhodanese-related sulfurtransferase
MTREMLEPFQGKPLIFYCSGALRAYHGANQAMEWGISPRIFWFKGGWLEWQAFTNSSLK